MSSSLADLRDATVAQPPTPPSSARLSFPAIPRGEHLFLTPLSPTTLLCFPFTAQRPQGFDHLRLINYDVQLSSVSAKKAKKETSPFSFSRGTRFVCGPPVSSESSSAPSPCASRSYKALFVLVLGSSQPSLQAHAYLQKGRNITSFSKTACILRQGEHRARHSSSS